MIKKVVVTGSTGFIGRHVLQPLSQRGYTVYPLSSQILNLFDRQATRELISNLKASHLMHLAWEVTPGAFWSSPKNRQWVEASAFLIETFIEQGGKRVLVAGSCAEYDWNTDKPLEESGPFLPQTLYGQSKRDLFYRLQKASGSIVWPYLFHLFGEHEKEERLIPLLIKSLLKEEKFSLKLAESVRDFLYIKDVADVLAALLDSEIEGGINIGSGEGRRLGAFAKEIALLLGKENLLEVIDPPTLTSQQEPHFLVPSLSRLQKELDWQPVCGLKKGIKETITWWKNR